jgi:Cd2+/Zn2+-exporting ATPase
VIAALVVLVGAALAIMRPRNDAANASDAGTAQTAQTFRTVRVPVEGMICMVCASSVKRRAEAIDGVTGAEVDLAGKRATMSYVDGKTIARAP